MWIYETFNFIKSHTRATGSSTRCEIRIYQFTWPNSRDHVRRVAANRDVPFINGRISRGRCCFHTQGRRCKIQFLPSFFFLFSCLFLTAVPSNWYAFFQIANPSTRRRRVVRNHCAFFFFVGKKRDDVGTLSLARNVPFFDRSRINRDETESLCIGSVIRCFYLFFVVVPGTRKGSFRGS